MPAWVRKSTGCCAALYYLNSASNWENSPTTGSATFLALLTILRDKYHWYTWTIIESFWYWLHVSTAFWMSLCLLPPLPYFKLQLFIIDEEIRRPKWLLIVLGFFPFCLFSNQIIFPGRLYQQLDRHNIIYYRYNVIHYKQIKLKRKYLHFCLTVLVFAANTCFTQTSEEKLTENLDC